MAGVGVYLPQVGFTWDELRARATLCDRLRIASLWLMDHLAAPGLPRLPGFEAWTMPVAAVTERTRLGPLVLANHPSCC